MSQEPDTKAFADKAKDQEDKFQWLEAAQSHKEVLLSRSLPAAAAAETWERIGFCYNLASRQSGSSEEFVRLRQMAVEAYNKAAELLEKENSLENQGKKAQCKAIAQYVSSWLASDPSERKDKLDDCRTFGNESLALYEKSGDQLSYGKMCNNLLLCLLERLQVASDWKEMSDVAREGINCADRAVAVLSKLENKNELLRAYSLGSLLSWYAANISDREEKRRELVQASLSYSQKALELSKDARDPYSISLSNWAATFSNLLFTDRASSALEYSKEMIKQATSVGDNYLKGVASYVLTFVTDWTIAREEDPDKRKAGYEEIIGHTENAVHYLQLVAQDSFIAGTYLFAAQTYSLLARDVVTTLQEKREMLQRAVEFGRKGLEHATRSGSPDATGSVLHALSKALHFYSEMEPGKNERIKLLKEALAHREEYNRIVERAFPYNDWVRGVGKNYEGLITAELARAESNREQKKALLENAVADMEESVSRSRKWVASHPVPTLIATVARFEDWFGGILDELYLLTEDKKILSRAIEVYEDAAKRFKKVNLPSRVAESYWEMARSQDRLGKHEAAAGSFENAFAEYRNAAQKTHHFTDFFLDYASYMKAWSEIERAKFAHNRDEYATAMGHYERTASLLEQSKLWGYLSSNFHAWSLLEQAEDLSRKEKSSESIEAFENAAQLFKEAGDAFEEKIGEITVPDERGKAAELGDASLRRREYCSARVNVERARVADREGAYAESAEKYDLAADIFEKILETAGTETYRKEIEPIAHMCRAWQKMKMADERDSPELYQEASDLFLKAREYSTKARTSMLASGNNALCKALEFGTRFETTRDKDDFSQAKQYLVGAANYYLKAGFENASAWTRATEILFDAYNFMSSAELEADPGKRTKIYLLAEKCLERAAELYDGAGYAGKREEVLRTLKKTKEKSEFAISLGELLAAPSDASSTAMISTLGLTVEEPVGLSKFEGALIEANMIAPQREVLVGRDISLEIHVANLGKDAAFLMKVEDLVSEGFDLIRKPAKYTLDDGFLNLKGRKLDALGTEEMKLALKARKKGNFVLKPKIQYMSESGEYQSCELEQVTLTVKEMGIRGWLRGPG